MEREVANLLRREVHRIFAEGAVAVSQPRTLGSCSARALSRESGRNGALPCAGRTLIRRGARLAAQRNAKWRRPARRANASLESLAGGRPTQVRAITAGKLSAAVLHEVLIWLQSVQTRDEAGTVASDGGEAISQHSSLSSKRLLRHRRRARRELELGLCRECGSAFTPRLRLVTRRANLGGGGVTRARLGEARRGSAEAGPGGKGKGGGNLYLRQPLMHGAAPQRVGRSACERQLLLRKLLLK